MFHIQQGNVSRGRGGMGGAPGWTLAKSEP